MNLLFRVLYAQKCSSTHHRLAMDALRYLRLENDDAWAQLFLARIQTYLDGSKAPDRTFKDFRNHVLHVSDNYWGGAISTAGVWYERLVDRLQAEDWGRAVYCAGVLSHYVTDPMMPLHTAQTEEEAQVHRNIEWGTSRIYPQLVSSIAAARILQNWKPPAAASDSEWLSELIRAGASHAHSHYEILIDHYDPKLGQKNPAHGFDDVSRQSVAACLAWSIKATAGVLVRAITSAGVQPEANSPTVAGVLSGLATPLFWITRQLADLEDRKAVQAIWKELQQTGRVIDNLPEDDRVVREAHAQEVLGITVDQLNNAPIRKAGQKWMPESSTELHAEPQPTETNTAKVVDLQMAAVDAVPAEPLSSETKSPRTGGPRFYLNPEEDVVDAPSIGPKTAARLQRIGILTVAQLLDAEPQSSSDALGQRWITHDVFRDWQRQSELMCRVPGLRGHDAQLLVGIGITQPEQLRDSDAGDVLIRIQEYSRTPEGERILRGSPAPDLAEVQRWQQFTDDARQLRAA